MDIINQYNHLKQMPLKPSEIRFNIPIRLYDPNQDTGESEGYTLYKSSPSTAHKFIVDYVAIFVDDIKYYGATFYKYDDFDIVLKEGADATQVIMKDGEEFFCHWDKKTFEQKYNAHIEKLEKDMQEDSRFQLLEIDDNNLPELKKAIKDYEKQRKLQKEQITNK